MAFQQAINYQPAPAIEGDFCSANPRASLLAGAGALISGPLGVIAGRFGWANNYGVVTQGAGASGRIGFIHRDNLSLNTIWLGRSTMLVLPNVEITLHQSGDFWMRFAGGASPGQKVFANYADGSVVAGVSGSPPAAGAATGSIAPASIGFTGSITPANPFNTEEQGGVLQVTAPSGYIAVGSTITGAGVIAGNQILSQVSGAPGGVGLYEVSIAQNLASEALTATYGILTVASGLSGSYAVGDQLAGGTTAAGTAITGLGTGAGGLGTYYVNNTQTVVSGPMTSSGAQETAWYVASYAAAGELAKTTTSRQV